MKGPNHQHVPKLYGSLTAHDFEYGTVEIRFKYGEGSCIFRSAFFCTEDDFYVVYTEHCGYHTFYIDSVEFIQGKKNDLS